MRNNVTENLGALVDIESASRITFDINPDSFDDSKNTEFAEIPIPGMSHPRLQFTNGSTRTLSFTIYLHYGAADDVPKAIQMLQSWLYPEYDSGHLKKAPSRLLLVFGDTWPDEQWVMKTCNVTRQRFDKELNCTFAEVSIELIEFIEKSRDAQDLRRNNFYDVNSQAFQDDFNGIGYFEE